ncbi:alkanesulfonates transport system permease protein [Klebsiella michiganensis]|uniref:Alkanesulfonates transport system permease protein n=1 Tax=Klebsiella michiganensis TaxID=1134687 RepID=A0A7H4LZ59_9ENTR|nr:alkanesulfonates transport system permease protein [Klebsiella michiganensis]
MSLIVVELLASSEGIGYLMVWGRQLFQLDIVFVTIAVVGLSGMLMEWAANRACARLVFWPQPAAGRLAWKPQASWRALQLPLVLLALWQLASSWGWIDGALFSSPLAVATRFIQGALSGELTAAMLQASGEPLSAARWGLRGPALRTAAGAAPARRANLHAHAQRAAPYRPVCLAAAADRMGGQR